MQTYNDRRAVFIVTRPYRSHAATKLSYCHLRLLQCQVGQVGSYLWKFEKNFFWETASHGPWIKMSLSHSLSEEWKEVLPVYLSSANLAVHEIN